MFNVLRVHALNTGSARVPTPIRFRKHVSNLTLLYLEDFSISIVFVYKLYTFVILCLSASVCLIIVRTNHIRHPRMHYFDIFVTHTKSAHLENSKQNNSDIKGKVRKVGMI